MRSSYAPKQFGIFSLAACAVVFSIAVLINPAFAQTAAPDKPLTILITASRVAETVDETLSPVTVITRDEIDESQAATVQEVLQRAPGVSFGNNGGVGQTSSMFLRGTESNHVLVLIDGVKVGSATSGLTQFENIPLSQVEKIEVVRGPRSALYGSEAIGGVIQIFTKGGGNYQNIAATIGSHSYSKIDAGLGVATARGWFSFGVANEKTNGYDACAGFGAPTYAGCSQANGGDGDDDGYKNTSLSVRGGVNLGENLKLEGNFLRAEGDSEFDSSAADPVLETVNQIIGLKLVGTTEASTTTVNFAQHKDLSDNLGGAPRARTSQFNTKRRQFNMLNELRLNAEHRLLMGVDVYKDEVDYDNGFGGEVTEDELTTTGFFGSWRGDFGEYDLQADLRREKDEQFGGRLTGNLAFGRQLDDHHRAVISYGNAFKAPLFTDLYFFSMSSFGTTRGNPDLDPEKSRSVDLGIIGAYRNFGWAANFYQTKINDLIDFVSGDARSTVNGEMVNYINRSKVEITGLEWSGNYAAGPWDLRGSVNLLEAKDAESGDDLLRRPKRIFDMDVGRQIGKWLVGGNLYNQSDSEDIGNMTNAGFAMLNLRAQVELASDWSLGFKVNNATDKEYETAAGYPQDGRNWLITLRYATR